MSGNAKDLDGQGLTAGQFRQIAKNGIGDPANAYVHGMAWYEGRLYCGMTRNSFKLLKLFPPIDPPALDPWPVEVPPRVEDLDMQGQIWRWTPETDDWELAFRSPMIPGKKGEPAPRDLGYRGMTVFQGASDEKPTLYVSTMSTVLRGCAAHVLRSEDGLNFEPACEPGIGNDRISTFRELVSFDGWLYAPPAGEGIQFNSNRSGVLMRSKDPRPGNWEVACDLGFGDPTNNGIFMMTVANGQLYAGTFNNFEGYQIWTTPPCGDGPLQWRKVIDKGAYRGPVSEIAMAMVEFNGALYVGSSIQNGGYDRTNLVGPASGEVIRIWPDGSWDLLVGSPRETPDGVKYPLSGLGPGFDNIFAGYTWRMCVHDGWLYTTTFDWSVFLQYAHRPSPTSKRLLNGISYEQLASVGGGFEMWRTRDGVNWMPVTLNGMGNPFNYGGRTMVSTPKGLAVGTANVFGGKSPARLASRWEYIENPDGGTEVFIGNGDTVPYKVPAATGRKKTPLIAATGLTGYFGSHALPHLLKAGYRLRVLTLPGTAGDIPAHKNLEVIEGTLEDKTALSDLVAGAETVVHMAARLAGACTRQDLRRTNVDGTHDLLRACIADGTLKHFVFTSSVAVYQHQFTETEWPIHEAHALRMDADNDLAEYGMSKIAGENLVQHYGKQHGFDHAILRLALVYGVGDPLVAPMVRDNAPDPGFGSGPGGDQQRQFVHIDDAVEALLRAIFQPEARNVTFNVAGPDLITYRDLGKMTRIAIGQPGPGDLSPDRTRIWRRYVQQYDMSRARTKMGFSPRVPFAEGLRRIIEAEQAAGHLPVAEGPIPSPGNTRKTEERSGAI
ncbi:NAD-dependent epimerase/dehydratase family protein [Rhodovulum adriaticum]|uniref:Nucleoside-diphosphate-sugar epimerase n=1 Tax=Rhodovulum adriaticum TaxID=35804 RepID=A0A4R2NTR8_RHOAD|nr:NAD(P)-dependent oxidoreductase [Rhodovulum adriaticum]MBK1635017.1 NAD-dependent dehydratase [Rhodovulum adriaticum]TCP25350.1 nucleoside-diphosphate-sugar epimerase [Rhodovulum adriaticum]